MRRTQMTERERVLLRREGAREALAHQGLRSDKIELAIQRLFPLPKKKVPREIIIYGITYRCVNGVFEWKSCATDVWKEVNWLVSRYSGSALVDLGKLKLNPDMEVDDD